MNFRKDQTREEVAREVKRTPQKLSWQIEDIPPGIYEFGKGPFAEVIEGFEKPPKIKVAPAELGRASQITTTGFMLNWNGAGEKPRLTVMITA